MDDDVEKLACPECGNTGRFYIVAEKFVEVRGSNYLDVVEEDGTLEYGGNSPCRCGNCGFAELLDNFYA